MVFECVFEECGRTFTRKARLDDHITTHTGDRPHICPEPGCEKTFARASYLQRHAATHSEARPHTCTQCGAAFKNTSNLRKHERSHAAGRRLYTCEQCSGEGGGGEEGKVVVNFAKKSQLHRHLSEVHGVTAPHQCDLCDLTFTTRSHLNRHQKRAHLSVYLCTDCGQQFPVFSALQRHISTSHKKGAGRPWCGECEIAFSSASNLESHRRREHTAAGEDGEERVERRREVIHPPATAAGKWSDSLDDEEIFEVDIESIKEEEEGEEEEGEAGSSRHLCPTCSKEFRSKSTLSCHQRRAHKIISITEYECSECSKVFKHKPNLVKHLQSVHQGIKRFGCEECPARFFYKQAFERHLDTVHRNPKKRKVTVPWNKKSMVEEITGHIESADKREYVERMRAVPVEGS